MTDEEVEIAKSVLDEAVAPLIERIEKSEAEIKAAIVSLVAQMDQVEAATRDKTAAPRLPEGSSKKRWRL